MHLPVSSPPRDRAALARDLANIVRGEVRFDAHNRMLYATDASVYQVEPIGVVIPADVEDGAEAARFCLSRGVAVLPRGGGTSLAGQCTNHAVVIDFSAHCRRIVELDPSSRRVRVEPGITVDDLNDQIASTGLFFAPDPATSRHASIGGCIGNNAAGARSIRYGRTSESLTGVEVIAGTGDRVKLERGAASGGGAVGRITEEVARVVLAHAALIDDRFPKTVRRNAGYGLDMVLAQLREPYSRGPLDNVNLAQLVAGSEGTLAITLGAELMLHPKPAQRGLAVLGFDSLDAAIDAVNPILATTPTAIELLDDTVIDLARANTEYRAYVDLMPQPPRGALKSVLYVEYFADGAQSELRERFERLRAVVPGCSMHAYTDAAAMLNAWKLRKAGEPLLHGIPGDRKPLTFVEDNAVPVERLPEFVRRFKKIVADHGTRAAYYAHASVGVLHVRPLLDLHSEEDRARLRSIAVQVADMVRELGGVMSGEHGDGRVRSPLLERFYGPELMNAMREVKRIFDPRNLLNPGNIVEPRPIESITQRLRILPDPGGPAPRIPEIRASFAYADQHGLGGAVEMCNGAGVCRKKSGGTMCPSYQATLDERHSTRGRGNALRLAITGQLEPLGGSRWDDPGVLETLNLCLSCKACKTECPSNVDISRLKAEYLSQRHRVHRPSLQTLLFASVRGLSKLASLTPGLANAMNSTRAARWVLRKLAGIDPRRSLPRFCEPLPKALDREGLARPAAGRPVVALFGDCFTMFNESQIGVAAARVFEALGYEVRLADAGCCGRAKISTGMVPLAIEQIDATLTRLSPIAQDPEVRAILVAEPSCLSAITDDWLDLRLLTPMEARRAVAAKAMLPEQFLARRWETHPRAPAEVFDASRLPGDVALHGHCHQKALWGERSSAEALRTLLGDRLHTLATGCCGMAGSFGFTTDRYDLSEKIAEGTLLPALRARPEATVAAPGTSCRHQVHDLAGRHAMHPIEIIARMLREPGAADRH